jgi:CRISPR-associated protein Cmr4
MVVKGGLWYEEALPAETILSGIVAVSPVKASSELVFATLDRLVEKPLQLGGKATVGRGLCRVTLGGGDQQ